MNWNELFEKIKLQEYAKTLKLFLDEEYKNKIIYPPRKEMFNAFKYCTVNDLKVVIIGQDPYHEPHQAMGLCFAVNHGVALPPSLKNIYKEIENEYHVDMSKQDGDLTYLAKQGVLLLNSILSVEKGNHYLITLKNMNYFLKTSYLLLTLLISLLFFYCGEDMQKVYLNI